MLGMIKFRQQSVFNDNNLNSHVFAFKTPHLFFLLKTHERENKYSLNTFESGYGSIRILFAIDVRVVIKGIN